MLEEPNGADRTSNVGGSGKTDQREKRVSDFGWRIGGTLFLAEATWLMVLRTIAANDHHVEVTGIYAGAALIAGILGFCLLVQSARFLALGYSFWQSMAFVGVMLMGARDEYKAAGVALVPAILWAVGWRLVLEKGGTRKTIILGAALIVSCPFIFRLFALKIFIPWAPPDST